MKNIKILIIILVSFLAFMLSNSLIAQDDAYRQLQRAAGQNSVNVPPVNGPVPVGEQSSSSYNTDNSSAIIIAEYQRKAVSINNQGVLSHNAGNYRAAIKAYKKALWYDPYNETARNNLKNAREAQRNKYKYNRDLKSYTKAEQERKAKAERDRLAQVQRDSEAANIRNREQNNNTNNLTQTGSSIVDKLALVEAEKAQKDLEDAKIKLAELKIGLDNTNKKLKMYSKSLANNSSELDSWAEEVDKTYANTLKVSKEYFMQMFLKYSLLTNLDPKYKTGPYQKLEELLQSSDPVKKQWLLNEFADKNLQPKDVSKFVDLFMANADAASIGAQIFDGSPADSKTQLDAVLFINSVFEAKEWVKYEELKDCPMFKQMANVQGKTMPGDWFTQAKVIGEVYSDIVVQCVSWQNINRLNEDSESMSQKVNLLIYKQEQSIKQINCLEECIKGSDGKCMNKCTGKSKLHTPPPFLE